MEFPAGAKFHPALRLVTWHPRGVLDLAFAREMVRFTEAQEQSTAEPFDVFADLSGLDSIRLGFDDVEELAQRRVEIYHGPPVKTAILALNPLAFGMARMYEQLMRRSPIQVRVFTALAEAAEWLGVAEDALRAGPRGDKPEV